MCKILKKTRRKSYTGFKIVCKINGKYYSSVTGIEYKPGSVTPVDTIDESKTFGYWSRHVLDPDMDSGYCKEMHGKTCVFKEKSDALDFLNSRSKEQLVEMTISGEIWEAEMRCLFGFMSLFVGTEILSIKEIRGSTTRRIYLSPKK